MPKITCPYCQLESASKFLHKTHLRQVHPQLHNNNIRTSITGAQCEIVQPVVTPEEATHDVQTQTELTPVSPGVTTGLRSFHIEQVVSVIDGTEMVDVTVVIMGEKVVLKFPASSIMMIQLGSESKT